MLRIGLTGGIGAGKSAVARRLARHGAVVIDSDALAREVVAPGTPGLAAVVEAFGAAVLDAEGALDRPRLGSLVFADSAARRRLNEIVHPLVRRRSSELMDAAGRAAIVVNDVPLLVENGLAPAYHLVLVVESSANVRVERLVRDRGMSEEDARARLAAQATDSQRAAVADAVLVNHGTVAELEQDVDSLWEARISPYAGNIVAGRRVSSPLVVLSPYQERWPADYERLAARIAHAAGQVRLHHVGSTAVPGLAAKDVIDIQISVDSLDEADELRPALEDAGFPAAPEIRGDRPKVIAPEPEQWLKRYHGAADPGRPAHLHLRVVGTAGWRYALLFRDWLRADAEAAARYETEKRRLAARNPQREAYTEAKEPWFGAALPRAERWAAETSWLPPAS